MDMRWRRTGELPPSVLVDARLQLHHAVQLVVSVSISYLEPSADDSHTSLEWVGTTSALAGRLLSPSSGLRFALLVGDLNLVALRRGTVVSQMDLDGRTVHEAGRWTRGVLEQHGFDGARLSQTKHYEIPAHPVASGRAFDLAGGTPFGELAAYIHDAWVLTSTIRGEHAMASDPRVWPHHFDLATLIPVPTPNGQPLRTIGVGVSPGDDSYAEPYIYVGPYPFPAVDQLAPLSLGHWHTANWVGAVLTAPGFAGVDGAERALRFSREAIAACQRAFGATG